MRSIINLPHVLAIEELSDLGMIRQIIEPGCRLEADVINYDTPQLKGKVIVPAEDDGGEILVIAKQSPTPDGYDRVLQSKLKHLGNGDAAVDLSGGKWLRHPKLSSIPKSWTSHNTRLENVISSWANAFSYLKEDQEMKVKGLRSPQIGAVHAVHAHWAVTYEAATIVMPTGTGKTETMLSILISNCCQKILVIVPTDALRSQIANKFLTLGILKDGDCRILAGTALYPSVGVLKQKPKTGAEVKSFFEKCHVVVTTSHIACQCKVDVQEQMVRQCHYLFIDEAHHTPAPTWSAFKKRFASKHILQFTATPFREDGKIVEGKIIFKYPLKKAQEDGHFKPIRFKPVFEFNPKKADKVIAAVAVEQLQKDRKHNHILMARVDSLERAKEVFPIYEEYKEFNPVQLHTDIKSKKDREEIREKILSGNSKIVVCVNMLGEGFDLPELKIAAFHDIRKSLAVTLQLAGRFTRSRPDLGEATVIANIADVNVRDELRKLYTQEPDWNLLLPELSEKITHYQVSLQEFLGGFRNSPDEIPLKNVRPAMSTVIYKTNCSNWTPEKFREGIPGIESFARVHHDINYRENTLVIVTAREVPLDWVHMKDIHNWDWELYILFWDRKQQLLFIHNSNNRGYFKQLAKAVADKVELIQERNVFRCFAGITRRRYQNIGLTEHLGRNISYTGRMGSDVEPGISDAEKQNTRKATLFGTGFENGRATTIGASRRGRIWSFATTNIEAFTRWCSCIGQKVLDETINPDDLLKGTLSSGTTSIRPPIMPIGVDWPDKIYKDTETAFSFILEDGSEMQLLHTDIALKEPSEKGKLRFEISNEKVAVEIVLTLFKNNGAPNYRFSVVGNKRITVKHKMRLTPLEDFFDEYPPVIWFVDGSCLEGHKLILLDTEYEPYDRKKIHAWDWAGVNLRKESQGVTKRADSIQFRVLKKLKKSRYNVIFDDDDSGEAADIVTIRVTGKSDREKTINVDFYHCKYSQDKPGQRIDDLYEVCGQAQKSIHWMRSHDKQIELFSHLLRREPRRKAGKQASRFEKGDQNELIKIREMSRVCPVRLRIFIVQPGLSKNRASHEQLELLSVTENYLMETYKLPFGVIASP